MSRAISKRVEQTVVNFAAIPAELRALKQWVVWRKLTLEDGSTKKPPLDPNDLASSADVCDPLTWGSFEQAVNAYRNGVQQGWELGGIGFVFTKDDPYFGVDIDDEARVAPADLEERRARVRDLTEHMRTYAEASPSGKGFHLIGKGRMPVNGRQLPRLKMEFYYAERFFTITGDVYPGYEDITDQQDLINQIISSMPKRELETNLTDTETYRRVDMDDGEVLKEAVTRFPGGEKKPSFWVVYNTPIGTNKEQGDDWSGAFYNLITMLDKITGNINQLERLVFNSPLVTQSPPARSADGSPGQSRPVKARRDFHRCLSKIRPENNLELHHYFNGKRMDEGMKIAALERAAAAQAEYEAAQEKLKGLSKGAVSILEVFPYLNGEQHDLTRPPGITGRFVEATERASYNPFMKFAIPVTLATLSGIVSRGFKIDGLGLNCNYILAAPSNAGKTQVMKVWERFTTEAMSRLPTTLMGPAKQRIVNSSTASIQAMLDDFQATPSMVWYVEECKALMSAMADPKSHVDSQLRDKFNELYDCSTRQSYFIGPKSQATKKMGNVPVLNLNVSTFWTTTTSKFDMSDEDALDGFMSRVIVIRHKNEAGEPVRHQEALPFDLLDTLTARLDAAKRLDEAYMINAVEANNLVLNIDVEQIREMLWTYRQVCHAITKQVLNGHLPSVYGAVGRIPVTAIRIAGLLAVMENPYLPVVTPQQYTWAVGYLLQNLVSLLTDMDSGELGSKTNDEVVAIVTCIKELMKKKEHRDMGGVPRNLIRKMASDRKPFSEAKGGRSQAVSKALTNMLAEKIIYEQDELNPTHRGPSRKLIIPNFDSPEW